MRMESQDERQRVVALELRQAKDGASRASATTPPVTRAIG